MTGGLKYRSSEAELLDDITVPEPELFRNLSELDKINRWLGGHGTTIEGIKHLLGADNKQFTLTDVGCGGGDTLHAISSWAKRNHYKATLKGIDILPGAINYARSVVPPETADFSCRNVLEIPDEELSSDIICCNMVLHHLYGKELEGVIDKMYRAAKIGVVINDLHRHPLAFYGIKFITGAVSRSRLVKHDAPLSVKKGFVATDLHFLFKSKNYPYLLKWKWAFRYLVILKKD